MDDFQGFKGQAENILFLDAKKTTVLKGFLVDRPTDFRWFSDFRLELTSHILSASNSDLMTSFKTFSDSEAVWFPSTYHPFSAHGAMQVATMTRQKQWTPRAGVQGDSRALFEPPLDWVPSGNQTWLAGNPFKKGHFNGKIIYEEGFVHCIPLPCLILKGSISCFVCRDLCHVIRKW